MDRRALLAAPGLLLLNPSWVSAAPRLTPNLTPASTDEPPEAVEGPTVEYLLPITAQNDFNARWVHLEGEQREAPGGMRRRLIFGRPKEDSFEIEWRHESRDGRLAAGVIYTVAIDVQEVDQTRRVRYTPKTVSRYQNGTLFAVELPTFSMAGLTRTLQFGGISMRGEEWQVPGSPEAAHGNFARLFRPTGRRPLEQQAGILRQEFAVPTRNGRSTNLWAQFYPHREGTRLVCNYGLTWSTIDLAERLQIDLAAARLVVRAEIEKALAA